MEQQEIRKLMDEVLQDDRLCFFLETFHVQEEEQEFPSRITAKVRRSDQEELLSLEGRGVGVLHAFFEALRARLGEEFPSMGSIILSSFHAGSIPGSDREDPTDAEAEVTLLIENSYGDPLQFIHRSRSLLRASLDGLLEAVEYFVNSERTYIRLYKALEHYRAEGRSELVDKYTRLLSQMVRNTSYSEVIERLKQDEG